MSIVQNRYDFVYYFDCHDGNPNGDPDADNSPRMDPETAEDLVSDVCLKRKVRDYVFQTQREGNSRSHGYDIYVLSGYTLESRQREAYEHLQFKNTPESAEPQAVDGEKKAKPNKKAEKDNHIQRARAWMCENFFDVRAFGAVMSTTDFNCGQVRGPIQMTFARSVDPIFVTDHTITRQAYTREDKAAASKGETEIGHKHTIRYGLYRAHGFISPIFAELGPDPAKAKGTGFTEEDLGLFWKALCNMFDIDRSAARGLMAARKLIVFKHGSKPDDKNAAKLGVAPAHVLFEKVKAEKKPGVISPRSFDDYTLTIPSQAELPEGFDLLLPCE